MANSLLFTKIIDDNIPMQPLHPEQFDALLANGWRFLGSSIIRHNFAICRSQLCNTIPLRIDLKAFKFSKSQRQLLRRSSGFRIEIGPIRITPEKETLFSSHTMRFHEKQPSNLQSFIGPDAASQPVEGREIMLYLNEQLVACSYFHLGMQSMSGTYCFFNPSLKQHSLGSLTMLMEIELALQLNMRYYYHGYCYTVPSQFDYKRNFNAMEKLDWETGLWSHSPRLPVRDWAIGLQIPPSQMDGLPD